MTSCPLRALQGGPFDVGTDREVFDLINMHRVCDRSQLLTVPFFRDLLSNPCLHTPPALLGSGSEHSIRR